MPTPAEPPRRILLVDDEADICVALKDLLETALPDVEVAIALDGDSGLLLAERWRPHLVVTDYKMPGMNGIELLQALHAVSPGTPAILVTAFPDLELAVRSINEGRVDSFLQKPVDPEMLLERVEAALKGVAEKHEKERALARALNERSARIAGADATKP